MTDRRPRSWTGDSLVQSVSNSPVVADTIQLTETTADISTSRDVTHKATYLTLHTRRLLTTGLAGVDFTVWLGKVLLGTSTPSQPQSPQASSKFPHADKDIMFTGGLKVPACIRAAADDTLLISEETSVETFEILVMRKFNRANQGIFLQVAGSANDAVQIRATWRTLLLV